MATALQQPEVAPGHGFVSEEARRRAEQARAAPQREKVDDAEREPGRQMPREADERGKDREGV